MPLSSEILELKKMGNFGPNIQQIPNRPEDWRIECLMEADKLQISGLITITE